MIMAHPLFSISLTGDYVLFKNTRDRSSVDTEFLSLVFIVCNNILDERRKL